MNRRIALSCGIDSAILAKYMPNGSIAYIFKWVVSGIEVTGETKVAKQYADECELEHKIIERYWEDFEKYAPLLMEHKKAPLQAKKDEIDAIVFGEAVDSVYGGLSGLLSKDWTIGTLIDRYSFLMPYRVLKDFKVNFELYRKWENEGKVDHQHFISYIFSNESIGSYIHDCEVTEQKLVLSYTETYMVTKMDYNRIRLGENKYFVREISGGYILIL